MTLIAAASADAATEADSQMTTLSINTSSVSKQTMAHLAGLALERVNTADLVAASKWISGQPIEDPVREQQVLDSMDAEAVRLGIDRPSVQRIFKDQIEANKLVQSELHERWRSNAGEAPTSAPDLGDVRDEINRINGELLTAIGASQPLLSTPQCSRIRVQAVDAVVRSQHPDDLHIKGLWRALKDLCVSN
ncbi:gamma subclass chorismate mutase AroQ [Streptomyces sp. NPDC052040]|uniref:gamma subclass chorismate mutase AroQ n=1 Tax=Streptomyces sp. NPDC052040 TaxID=3365682 RepID=UPI0037D012D0